MKLKPMQFKDYVWPHNPKTFSVHFERSMAVHKVPFGRYILQNMGMTRRVLQGEGEFAGENAYQEFKRLASVFYQESPGMLVHPIWQCANAYFVDLSLQQEPRTDYVKYSFTFWEAFDGYSTQLNEAASVTTASATPAVSSVSSASRCHTVASGETLWKIAKTNGIALTRLLKLNPQIKNPNLIHPGEQVRIL